MSPRPSKTANSRSAVMTELGTPSDVYMAEQLRAARMSRGLTQDELGKLAGVSAQQIGKYERGANRLAMSTLLIFAAALNYPIDHFLEDGAATEGLSAPDKALYGVPTDETTRAARRVYYRLTEEQRQQVISYAEGLLKASATQPRARKGKASAA